jgi:PTS system nitrogen regulatory IIA component
MNLKKPLTVETICLDLKGATKDEILAEMVDLLMASGHIRDREAVLKAITEREKRSGVDFGALDGQPSTIFVMTVSPDSRTGPHIQFLAEISRPLNDSAVRSKILAATSRKEVLKLLIA